MAIYPTGGDAGWVLKATLQSPSPAGGSLVINGGQGGRKFERAECNLERESSSFVVIAMAPPPWLLVLWLVFVLRIACARIR